MDPKQLTLRAVDADDLDYFFSFEADLIARWMAAFTSVDGNDRPAFDAHWARTRADPSVISRTIEWGNEIVGHVAAFDRFGVREVSYWIARSHWSRGIATQALRCFLAELRTRPLHARAVVDNTASMAVLQRCGFAVCSHERGFAAARGEEVDEVVMRLDA